MGQKIGISVSFGGVGDVPCHGNWLNPQRKDKWLGTHSMSLSIERVLGLPRTNDYYSSDKSNPGSPAFVDHLAKGPSYILRPYNAEDR